jgi:hypothetical protein
VGGGTALGLSPNPGLPVSSPSLTSTAVIKRKCTTHTTNALFGPITRTPMPHTVRLETDTFRSQSQVTRVCLGATAV